MRALITGATGFIGRYLVDELRRLGWEVVCVVRKKVQPLAPGITCVQGDLCDLDALDRMVPQVGSVDVLFHLGALMPSTSGANKACEFLIANGVATYRLLEIAETIGSNTFIYLSSISVLGQPKEQPVTEDHPYLPHLPYGLSKLFGELSCEMIRRVDVRRVISLRITSPYGSGMNTKTVLPHFVNQALASKPLEYFGSGDRTQNFVHVSDIVQACTLAVDCPNPGIYNVGGETISMRELAELIVRLTPGSKSIVRASKTKDPQEDYRWEIDLTRSRELLGYKPRIPLEVGIAKLIKNMKGGSVCRSW